jgi:hypothetical protein
MSAVGNCLSVGRDRLLRATLTTPAVTADLVRQALQKQMTELAAVLSASASQRPRMLVVVPPEDVKDGILEADGLQRALAPVTAAAGASNTVAAAPPSCGPGRHWTCCHNFLCVCVIPPSITECVCECNLPIEYTCPEAPGPKD